MWDLKCGWAPEPPEDVLARAAVHRVGAGEPQPGAHLLLGARRSAAFEGAASRTAAKAAAWVGLPAALERLKELGS